jgi:hypothetical protein
MPIRFLPSSAPAKTTPAVVTARCQQLLDDFLNGHEAEVVAHPHHRLHILASRGRGLLKAPRSKISATAGFSAAVVSNMVSRDHLARHLQRVILADMRDRPTWLHGKFDAFDTRFVPLAADNLAQALLASGTLPFIMEPVRGIAHAPVGTYWDGGLIDYHLALPYSYAASGAAGGLVLYPHFGERLVPGWLDKRFPWRQGRTGLDNVIMVSPSHAFLQTLPRKRLPDRKDFLGYDSNDALRIQHWKSAIGEGARLRDELATFVEKPNLDLIKQL